MYVSEMSNIFSRFFFFFTHTVLRTVPQKNNFFRKADIFSKKSIQENLQVLEILSNQFRDVFLNKRKYNDPIRIGVNPSQLK